MLLKLLKSNPKARERKNKNKAIAYVLQQQYEPLRGMSLDFLERIVKDVSTLDREWRHILQHNPYLRGSDYEGKEELVAKKIESLGYEVGSGYTNSQLKLKI